MKLQKAAEFQGAVPPGRYQGTISAAETANSEKSGAPMIKIVGTITAPEEYAGRQWYDNMITDEDYPGAGMGKKKLRGLGINVDVTMEDGAVCEQLLGSSVYVDLAHEPSFDKGPDGVYNVQRFDIDANGRQVKAMKHVPKAYSTVSVGGAVGQQMGQQAFPQQAFPQQPQMPMQQMPQMPQMPQAAVAQGPQGFVQQMPQQMPQQQRMQIVDVPQQTQVPMQAQAPMQPQQPQAVYPTQPTAPTPPWLGPPPAAKKGKNAQ